MNALAANRHNKSYEACWSCCSSRNMFEKKNSMNLMELAWTKLPYRHFNICFYLNDSLFLAFVCCHCYCKWKIVCLFFAANSELSIQLLSFSCFEPVFFFYSLHFFTWSIIQTRWFSLVYIAIVHDSYQKIYFYHVIHDETHKYMYLYILKYDICLRCDSIDSQCEFRIVTHPCLLY